MINLKIHAKIKIGTICQMVHIKDHIISYTMIASIIAIIHFIFSLIFVKF